MLKKLVFGALVVLVLAPVHAAVAEESDELSCIGPYSKIKQLVRTLLDLPAAERKEVVALMNSVAADFSPEEPKASLEVEPVVAMALRTTTKVTEVRSSNVELKVEAQDPVGY